MTFRTWFLLAAFAFGGCNTFLADRMIAPPNGRTHKYIDTSDLKPNETRLTLSSEGNTLAFWILEPRGPAKGTVLLLHGFIADHHQLNDEAKALQKAGYRAVLVDLPGHGKSNADYLTFGIEDAQALSKLTDYLQQKNLCGRSLGVYGTSYGASSAILFAASDPRVSAIVAVAPFASLRQEAPYFGKHVMPLPGAFMSPDDYIAVVNRMGKEASFDPDACDPLTAIKKTKAQVLLIHGTHDRITPTAASAELAAAAPGHSAITILDGKGHLELCLDWFGELRPQTRDWFDRYLSPSPEAPAVAKN